MFWILDLHINDIVATCWLTLSLAQKVDQDECSFSCKDQREGACSSFASMKEKRANDLQR
jgi:hypothetical protein